MFLRLLSIFFFFKQKTAYGMRFSDWSSDVCSSDLAHENRGARRSGNSHPGSVGRVPGDLSGDVGRPGSGASCVPEKDAGNGKERPRTRGAKVETMEGGAMTSEIYENV